MTGIVDRLHAVPATHMGDGAIVNVVRDALLQDVAFDTCAIKVKKKGHVEIVREALADPHGVIEVSVKDGVVLLDDHVLTPTQKRLAGVLAWWVPGSRDVINGLEVASLQRPDESRSAGAGERSVDQVRWHSDRHRQRSRHPARRRAE